MSDERGKHVIIKSISGIMICTIAYKFFGFLKELVLSYFFGTSGISDAYLISQQIPEVVFEFIGAGITTCFIPIYYKALSSKGIEGAHAFTNKLLTLTLTFSTIVIVIIELFAPVVVKIFASGFTGETLDYATAFTRICILSLFFSTFVFIYGSFLYANNRFMPSSLSAVVLSICVLISIMLGAKISIWIMSIGSCLAVGIRLLFIIPAAHKEGLKFNFDFCWKDDSVKSFFLLMIPVVIGTSVNEINTLIDRTIASQIAIGGISALTYANSMLQLATGGIVQPFSTVVYPRITEFIHKGQKDEAMKLLEKMINVLLFILIPITVGIFFFSRPIIDLLFSRGAFDGEALRMTSEAFVFYAIGLCFIGLRELLSRLYYACENTKAPVINSTIGLAINVILNLSLSRYIGLKGLALSTSISAIITSLLLLFGIKSKLNIKSLSVDGFEILKMVFSALIMGVVSSIMYKSLFHETKIGLVVSIICAVIIYVLLSALIKTHSIIEAKQIIETKIRGKKM